MALLKIPSYLQEVIERHYESNGLLREIIIKTPSAQLWNNLSVAQQNKWKELIVELGADPEDYLSHMGSMLPRNP